MKLWRCFSCGDVVVRIEGIETQEAKKAQGPGRNAEALEESFGSTLRVYECEDIISEI